MGAVPPIASIMRTGEQNYCFCDASARLLCLPPLTPPFAFMVSVSVPSNDTEDNIAVINMRKVSKVVQGLSIARRV